MSRIDKVPRLRPPCLWGCRCLLAFLFLAVLSTFTTARADQSDDTQILRKVQAGFIYNFIRFTTWPASSLPEDAPLIIAIIGESSSAETLRRQFVSKKYGNHELICKILEPDTSLEGVHIVFLLKKSPLTPADLAKRIGTRPILSIGEADNFTQSGGIIRLFVRDDTIHFSLNIRAARASELTVSSQLGSMAETDTP